MENLESFQKRFSFNPEGAFLIGIERECFIADRNGQIVPKAPLVIEHAKKGWQRAAEKDSPMYGGSKKRLFSGDPIGYELSACQIETRTMPTSIAGLRGELEWPAKELDRTLRELDLHALHIEVAPDDMPLDVYPDPTGRYAEITKNMPREVLQAACQVAGTHVHIGMPNHEIALRVYNKLTEHTEELCAYGGGLSGKRLEIYRKVAPDREPHPYPDWQSFLDVAVAKGFAENPRNCWTLVRLSIHGTIEFRMFGATDSIDRIVTWAARCHELCLAGI